MSGGYRLDSDGDVEMSVPQPVYEFITAPKLKSWDQTSLVTWTRERKRYVDKIAERCAVTGETPERICASVKSCFDEDILAVIARYVLYKSVAEVTDAELIAEVEKRCNHLKNDHVPDLDRFFRERLKMNMRIDDCDARILHYFADFDRIIEDNGLTAQLGVCPESDPFFKPRMKQRCKLLISSLQPEELRVEIQRMVKLEHREAATSCVKLYPLILQRARLQQHYHYLSKEFGKGREAKKPPQPATKTSSSAGKPAAHGGDKSKGDHAKQGAGPTASSTQARPPPRTGCWACKGPHWLDDCPTASDADKETARQKMAELRGSRRQVKRWRLRGYAAADGHPVRLNDLIDVPFCPDSGADANVVPRRVIDDLMELRSDVKLTPLSEAQEVEMYDGRVTVCTEEAHLDLRISTAAGPVNLYEVPCTVLDADTDEFLLGNVTLCTLGIDMDRMIEQLAVSPNVEDSDEGLPPDTVFGIQNAVPHAERLQVMLAEAMENGFPAAHGAELADLVTEYSDVFRSELELGEPARVEPLRVQLKDDAVPYRCKARSYPPLQKQFLREYTKELEERGLLRKNNSSRWASPALPVKKPGSQDEFRMTVDYRPVNAMTVPIAGTAPNLPVVTSSVRGSFGFASFDLHKGFWQMGRHEDSQEMFSIMTDDAVYTPTRVPQGATDSALHFQNQMHFVFDPLLYNTVLIWIDDVILFAKSVEEFLQALRKFFGLLREFNLKLNVMKSKLFQFQVKWCGRLISGDGVAHDPARVEALQELPLPATAGDLQYFLCAANWLRDSIVDYARHAAPLQFKLDAALKGTSRRRQQALRIPLVWSDEEQAAYTTMLQCIGASTPLAFPDPNQQVCVFSDASDVGYGIVVTQVAEWKQDVPVHEQQHQLLICKGGMFHDSQANWSIVEKEAFPIVQACTTMEYLLQRANGFRLYCDHSNLIAIFAPDKELKKHVKAKLQRWAMRLTGYIYTIEHISGSDNLWADIVSRWWRLRDDSQTTKRVNHVRTRSNQQLSPLRPLEDDAFEWPTLEEIAEAQHRHGRSAPREHTLVDGVICVDGKAWILRAAKELLVRLLVVAHAGSQGHRGEQATMNAMSRFAFDNAIGVVKRFVGACLLCKHVKGAHVIQRPWGPTQKCTRRNEVLHWDFLSLSESHGELRYVLVLKDDLTHYCELFACASPTASVTAEAMMDWYKRFGAPETWQSDNGTHFRNTVLDLLSGRLKSRQDFTPPYSPWINGTVERVNRDVLPVLRVLLMEYKLDIKEWPYLLPVVQANLNHTQLPSLGDRAPVELFTGLPASSTLDVIWNPNRAHDEEPVAVDLSKAAIRRGLDDLRNSLQQMHKEVTDIRERRRLHQMAAKKGAPCNFSEGDFVLWSRVDARLPGSKRMVRWVGPFRVVEALSHSFIIEHLITKARHDVHGSRLKFYSDSSLEVTEELIQHVSSQGILLNVEQFCGARYNDQLSRWELEVSWQGLEEAENSWEGLEDLFNDVPAKVAAFVEDSPSAGLHAAFDALQE